MKKSAKLSAALFLALGIAGFSAPALAAWTPVRAENVREAINALDADIDRADNNDTISEREARDLRSRLGALRSQFQRLNSNGLTRNEVRTLQSRTNYIRTRLRMERVDWDRRAG